MTVNNEGGSSNEGAGEWDEWWALSSDNDRFRCGGEDGDDDDDGDSSSGGSNGTGSRRSRQVLKEQDDDSYEGNEESEWKREDGDN